MDKIKREQCSLARKYKNLKKGESTQKNIQKQKLKLQRLYCKLHNIRKDYINKTIVKIVRTKPSYISIEHLNISGMLKNKHLAKALQGQCLAEFVEILKYKCKYYNIELRQVDRFYPSSKTCNKCGYIKADLKLSDRLFRCDNCNYCIDRDLNASFNLRDAKHYIIL